MKLVRGKIDTEGYHWHINIDELVNESLKEGLENQLGDLMQLPYVSLEFDRDTQELMIEVMDERFTSDHPLIFHEPFSDVITCAVHLYTASDRSIPVEIPEIAKLRDALQKEVEYLTRCIENRHNEREAP
jgi:hypothetical protein